MTLELVTFNKVKDFLQLEREESSYPELAIIAPSVVSAIENFIGRFLEQKERTEEFLIGSIATRFIDLKGIPIVSVSSASVTELGDSDTLTENEDFIISNGGIELLYTSFKRCKVSVTYTGGYAADNVPEDIQRAALLQTVYEYQSKDYVGASSVTTEGGSIQRPPIGLLKEVRRLLDNYKHPAQIV